MTKKIVKPHDFLFLVSCLGFFHLFLLRGVTLPFIGNNAWNFNTYSMIAHNYVKFGFMETIFAPIISVSKTLPENPLYYLHHPQLLSIVQAFFFYFLGESFFTARLPLILATFMSALFIFLIGKEVVDRTYAIISLCIPKYRPHNTQAEK